MFISDILYNIFTTLKILLNEAISNNNNRSSQKKRFIGRFFYIQFFFIM